MSTTHVPKSLNYTPIDPSKKQIRVIRLLRGAWDDQICCELVVVSLLDKPAYEALSYVWGDESDTVEIVVDGTPFAATRNLYAALRRLRTQSWAPDDADDAARTLSMTAPRMLWVDAVCINQQDFREKEHQVGMMGEIYGSTAHGLLWLGEEPEEPPAAAPDPALETLLQQTDELLKSMTDGAMFASLSGLPPPPPVPAGNDFVISKCRPDLWPERRDPKTLTANERAELNADGIYGAYCLLRVLSLGAHLDHIAFLRVEAEGQETFLTRARQALHWLVSRPWWTRIWTVQECILPKTSHLLYGPVQISFGVLLTAVDNFQRHRTGCCAAVPGVMNMLSLLVDTVLPCQNLQKYAKELGSEPAGQTASGDTVLSLFRPEALLWTFRSRQATNPKDKIYGIMSLIRGTSPVPGGPAAADVLAPDYSPGTTAEVVYTRAVRGIIEYSGSLDILSQPGHAQRDPFARLPSWVADFSQSLTFAGTLDRFTTQLPLYDACAGTHASAAAIEENILVLEGALVDRIERTAAGMMVLTEESRLDMLKDWLSLAETLGTTGEGGPAGWRRMFWRTLCGDTVRRSRPFYLRDDLEPPLRRIPEADAHEEAAFNDWCATRGLHDLGTGSTGRPEGEGDENPAYRTVSGNVAHAIKISTASRRFFLSTNGRMGLAPSYAGLVYPARDEVFVMPGGRAPFVLRPVGMRHVPGRGMQPCHQLIGDCYLHGYMDGEGMKDFDGRKQRVYLV